jgi:hypothetical protein
MSEIDQDYIKQLIIDLLKKYNIQTYEMDNESEDVTKVGDQWRQLKPTGRLFINLTLCEKENKL